ncbi:MAG: DNA-binding protein [Trichloromonadaceae bacterium]
MQAVATIETVRQAIQQLEDEGRKVTGRAVLAITGGSLGTVLKLIRQAQEEGDEAQNAAEIPEALQNAIRAALATAGKDARQQIEDRITLAEDMRTQALEGLQAAEARIEALEADLAAVRAQAEEQQREAEKAAAVAREQQQAAQVRIHDLGAERKQLIESGEAARIEAAKATARADLAELAATKAEGRVEWLQRRVEELLAGKK